MTEAREYWDGLAYQRQHINRGGVPKLQFDTKEAADNNIRKLLIENNDPRATMESYVCQICSRFHIGNSSRKFQVFVPWSEVMVEELGVRVVAQMWQESYGTKRKRRYHILKRFEAAEKRRQRGF